MAMTATGDEQRPHARESVRLAAMFAHIAALAERLGAFAAALTGLRAACCDRGLSCGGASALTDITWRFDALSVTRRAVPSLNNGASL